MGFIFGNNTQSVSKEQTSFKQQYEETDKINITSILATRLTNYIINQSNVNVSEENKTSRGTFLQEKLNLLWKEIAYITNRCVGEGGTVVIPYITRNTINFDFIGQNRLFFYEWEGRKPIGALIISEDEVDGLGNVIGHIWKNYRLDNGVSYVYTKKFNNTKLDEVKKLSNWNDVEPDIAITGCDRLLFAYFKSPVDPRNENWVYGVPITHGCKDIIDEIQECLKQISTEYKNKQALIIADGRLLDKNNKITKNLFKNTSKEADENFFQIFDPAIREQSFYYRLNQLYKQLEAQCSVSQNILSQSDKTYTNELDIMTANSETIVIVDKFREALKSMLDDYMYICDVFLTIINPALARSELNIKMDWYNAFENPTEQFARLLEGHSIGTVEKAEIRQWQFPDETIEQSQVIVDRISENQSLSLFGE